jgi:hypothetical protein
MGPHSPPLEPPKPEIGFHVKEDAVPYRTKQSDFIIHNSSFNLDPSSALWFLISALPPSPALDFRL